MGGEGGGGVGVVEVCCGMYECEKHEEKKKDIEKQKGGGEA